MTAIESILVGAAVLLLLCVVSSKASGKLGVPALLVFVAVGMLAGSEGPGGVYFDDPWTAQLLGVVALTLILFAGGLDTDWVSVRPVLWPAVGLSTVGVLVTALLVGCFASVALGFSLREGMLFGAIVSSTDAAAVFAVLRSRNVSLKGALKPLLELESGSNDPMAVFLTVGLVRLLASPSESVADLVPLFLQQMLLGGGRPAVPTATRSARSRRAASRITSDARPCPHEGRDWPPGEHGPIPRCGADGDG